MIKKNLLITLICLPTFLHCASKSDSKSNPPAPQEENAVPLEIKSQNLSGKIAGKDWSFKGGVAKQDSLGRDKNIYAFVFLERETNQDDCKNFFGLEERTFSAFGKREAGIYRAADMQILNVFQPGNLNTASGTLKVDSIKDGVISGGIGATFDQNNSISGSFAVRDCDYVAIPSTETCTEGKESYENKCLTTSEIAAIQCEKDAKKVYSAGSCIDRPKTSQELCLEDSSKEWIDNACQTKTPKTKAECEELNQKVWWEEKCQDQWQPSLASDYVGKWQAIGAELIDKDGTALSYDRIEVVLPRLPLTYSDWGISLKISYQAILGTNFVSEYDFNSLWAVSKESVEKIAVEGTSIAEKCTFYYNNKWNESFPRIGTWTKEGVVISEHFRDQSWDVSKCSYYDDNFVPNLSINPFVKDMLTIMAIDEKGTRMVGIFKRLITK